jgi:hypothetical protein
MKKFIVLSVEESANMRHLGDSDGFISTWLQRLVECVSSDLEMHKYRQFENATFSS